MTGWPDVPRMEANDLPFTVIVMLTVAEPSLSEIATEPDRRTLSRGPVSVKSMVSVVVDPSSATVTDSCTVTAGLLRCKLSVRETEEGEPEIVMLNVSVLLAAPAKPLVTMPETDAVKLELFPEPVKV